MPNKSKLPATGPAPRAKIPEVIRRAIQKAQDDYYRMSGHWMAVGPEYWVTSYVARALWKQCGDGTVVAEGSSDDTRRKVGQKPGRPSKNVLNKRYDIVLYFSNGTPRAVIEIKNNQQWETIVKDVTRVIDALKNAKLRFGAVGYYCEQMGGAQKSGKEKIKGYTSNLEERAKAIAAKDHFKSTLYKSIGTVGNNAWSAGCIVLERKQGNTQRT